MSLSPSGNCLSCASLCGLEALLPHLAGVVVERVDQLPGLVASGRAPVPPTPDLHHDPGQPANGRHPPPPTR